jgi:hypothetical protein
MLGSTFNVDLVPPVVRTDYKKRLNLPLEGSDDIIFYTKDGLEVAKGYVRVVIGERGPYIEFDNSHIIKESFIIPPDQAYRLTDKRVYYVEHRSKDEAYVKLYEQKKTVAYADYKIGKFYISPFDLKSNIHEVLVDA